MSLAFEQVTAIDRAVTVVRAGVVARDVCRRGGWGEIAAVFERSFYLRIDDDFICIGEPAISNGPTTLIITARVAGLGLCRGQRASICNGHITLDDLLLDFSNCQTWRAPPWPAASTTLPATCAKIAQRAATESPADSLARAAFGADDTPLARFARPRIAAFASWVPPTPDPSPPRFAWGEGNPAAGADGLVGLGPGLTPSGDDFLIGALAVLDALEQTNMHAALGHAVIAAAGRTSPLSASLLRAAAAGHVGENLHMMIAALVTGDADAVMAMAARIGHTSGWDALAGAVVTAQQLPYRC